MPNRYKKILCIQADNMGDLVMTTPALRALKETFSCEITLLTSAMAQPIAGFIPVVDEIIVRDLPWVKTVATAGAAEMATLVELLRSYEFDAVFIFTSYSQSPLPAAMLTMMAGIPERWAYCRENPYELLTHWIPDREPFQYIKHQVQRGIDLVVAAGAVVQNDYLQLQVNAADRETVTNKLQQSGIDIKSRYVIFHAGVSEEKREYPVQHWIEIGKIISRLNIPVILTGTARESRLTSLIAAGVDSKNIIDWAGKITVGELIALVDEAAAVVSVNTATIHIAAAMQTPLIVLYALTNPQDTPWKVKGHVFPFNIPADLQSKNEIIRYVRSHWMRFEPALPKPEVIAQTLELLLLRITPRDNISMDTLLQ